MTETLKRTFHGCLTCRKRKVRCLGGGNPCQNCTRMNITCHSSFETNLRIRVSTPNGQKAVDNTSSKSTTNKRPSPTPAPEVITTSANANTNIYSNNYHYSQFPSSSSLQQQSPGGFMNTTSFQYPDASAAQGLNVAEFDQLQHYPTTTTATSWNTFNSNDFAYVVDPSLDHHHQQQQQYLFNQTPSPQTIHHHTPPTQAQMAFNAWMPTGAQSVVPSSPNFVIDGNNLAGTVQQREGPKEWVPKRRRRNLKRGVKESSGSPAAPEGEVVVSTNGGVEGMMVMEGDGFDFGHAQDGYGVVGMGAAEAGWYGGDVGYGR
ncbi:hypothetical protein QBC38DRAFT_79494 [Podospora fimiseda]|uniref:Zn(2)-C6 fungal-type domain-containing protein n=1 Tax=Podospora fimiseda TaxID=252190 RepID=A0AAN7BUQ0_9PEZI|nr:hypothetical protein QBC38DRAFT_79494 [Podospora fimiseda]